MDKRYDILNVGIIVADLMLRLPCKTLDFQTDMIRLPEIPLLPGGDAANSAITAARLGMKVALCCKTGGDAVGKLVLDMVSGSGVDTSFATRDPSLHTNVSTVMVNNEGDRTLVCCSGNNRELSIEDIPTEAIEQAKHINISSIFAHPKLDRGGAAELFRRAKECGATTSADVTHDAYGTGFDGIKAILPYTDYIMPSYKEGRYLTGETEPEKMAEFLIRHGAGTAVIKMGGDGCFIQTATQCIRCPAYAVTPIDTTGAGDNFMAGFMTGLLNQLELEECGRLANAAAAMCTLTLGATGPITMDEVKAFMRIIPLKRR